MMATSAEVRLSPAQRDDLAAVTELLRVSGLPTEDLPTALEHFFVARAEHRLVGVIGLEIFADSGLVRSLAVAPDWRGRQVAHRLWNLLREYARGLGVRQLHLLTTTAEAIFARWGFERLAREDAPAEIRATEEFRTLCPSTAVLMRLAPCRTVLASS